MEQFPATILTLKKTNKTKQKSEFFLFPVDKNRQQNQGKAATSKYFMISHVAM